MVEGSSFMPPADSSSASNPAPLKRELGVWLIVGFKAFYGVLYLAVAVGVFSFMNRDLGALAERLVAMFNLDPDNHYINAALTMIPNITPQFLKQIAIGTLLYGAIELVQATGLYFRKIWAEWLIIIATMLLVPIEIMEIVKHATSIKFGVLVLNLLIVWYLYARHRKQMALHAAHEQA